MAQSLEADRQSWDSFKAERAGAYDELERKKQSFENKMSEGHDKLSADIKREEKT